MIVLEANAPITEEPTQHKWEDLLFGRGYSFALDDGLNRYYVQRALQPPGSSRSPIACRATSWPRACR